MLKVDLIFMSDINAPNGASVLIKKLGEAHDLFYKYGVDQRIISPATSETNMITNENSKKTKPSLARVIVRFLSKYSTVITFLRFYRLGIRQAERVIDLYEKLGHKGDVVVFHELLVCYAYHKRFKNDPRKTVLVIHGNGELWKMVYFGFPRLKSFVFYPFKKKIENTVFNNCEKIGFDADLPRRTFCSAYARYERKTFFAYNGIDIRPCPKRDNITKLRLLCLATLSDRKNQMGILNAVGLLREKYQQMIEIVFVGDGSIKEALEERANQLIASVLFVGAMNESEYYKYLMDSNCFCLFSKDEGLPIAVIEGMRAGLPVIGSKVGGIPEEVLDGKTGFLVDLDEDVLKERIKWMIDHLDSLRDMGEASYQYFLDNFTTEAMVKKYVDIYKC